MKYTVLERSFINNRIVEEGDVIDFDGEPGPNLEPVGTKETLTLPKGRKPGDEPVNLSVI